MDGRVQFAPLDYRFCADYSTLTSLRPSILSRFLAGLMFRMKPPPPLMFQQVATKMHLGAVMCGQLRLRKG